MSVIVKAPKCRDGQLKNHFSTVKDESVEWKDGVAEVSEKAWNVLKGIPGYELCEPKKPAVIPIEPGTVVDIKEVMRENSENLELLSQTDIQSDEEPEPLIVDEKPEVITETVVESEPFTETPEIESEPEPMVTANNTVKEIREFAKSHSIALGNAQSKKDLLKKIKKHFE